MNEWELFEIWAPSTAGWSRWAKPVLFTERPLSQTGPELDPTLPEIAIPLRADTAIVVDLPGAESVRTGLALAQQGYRPVPLFNGVPGTSVLTSTASVINTAPIQDWLIAGAAHLSRLQIPAQAPPAFLLDSRRRQGEWAPSPGRFDNRWIVLPQDFPSAACLQAEGIALVLLIMDRSGSPVSEDLAHVLLRWQEAGLRLRSCVAGETTPDQSLAVRRPTMFRALWYRALATMGLRRHSAGGFGGIVPQPSSG